MNTKGTTSPSWVQRKLMLRPEKDQEMRRIAARRDKKVAALLRDAVDQFIRSEGLKDD